MISRTICWQEYRKTY